MEIQPELRLEEFRKTLTRKHLFSVQFFALTHLVGVTFFLGVILFMYFQKSFVQTTDQKILSIFSAVHICMATVFYVVVFLIIRYFFSEKTFDKYSKTPLKNINSNEVTLELRALFVIRTCYIIRLAVLEGIASFGLIICFTGVRNGEIQSEPFYWFNLFSYVIFALMILWTFPTKTRLEAVFQRRFMNGSIF